MPIFKSLPIIKIINGKEIKTSEAVVVIDTTYKTNGESVVVVKEVDECNLFLDSNTTDHVVVKALTNVVVSANETIDEEFHKSHRANLLRKDAVYYGAHGWNDNPKLPYRWYGPHKLTTPQPHELTTPRTLYLE